MFTTFSACFVSVLDFACPRLLFPYGFFYFMIFFVLARCPRMRSREIIGAVVWPGCFVAISGSSVFYWVLLHFFCFFCDFHVSCIFWLWRWLCLALLFFGLLFRLMFPTFSACFLRLLDSACPCLPLPCLRFFVRVCVLMRVPWLCPPAPLRTHAIKLWTVQRDLNWEAFNVTEGFCTACAEWQPPLTHKANMVANKLTRILMLPCPWQHTSYDTVAPNVTKARRGLRQPLLNAASPTSLSGRACRTSRSAP